MGKTRLEALSDGVIRAKRGERSMLAQAVHGHELKRIVPFILYAAAIPLAFVHPAASGLLVVAVAVMWLAPDRRIEARIRSQA